MHWPLPSTPAGKLYTLATSSGVNGRALPARGRLTFGSGLKRKCARTTGRLSKPKTPSMSGATSFGTLIVPDRWRNLTLLNTAAFSLTPNAACIALRVPDNRTVR